MTTKADIEQQIYKLHTQGKSNRSIALELLGRKSAESTVRHVIKRVKHQQGLDNLFCAAEEYKESKKHKLVGPKVLVADIEASPILGYVWSLWKQNVGLNQIKEEWYLLSFAAKWLGDPEEDIIYMDQRDIYPLEDDTKQLAKLWQLLDEADWLITQNGKAFDIKKIRARMVMAGFPPFSPVKHIDNLEIAKKVFGFTSNKLEWMTDKLCTKYKKNKHQKFSGFELWSECLKRNQEAFMEMELYNRLDILSLEELYYIVSPWSDRLPNPNLYTSELNIKCICGSENIQEHGFATTEVSKFQQYQCKDCGKIYRGRKNLLTKEKRETILTNAREN